MVRLARVSVNAFKPVYLRHTGIREFASSLLKDQYDVLFMGTDEIAVQCLTALHQNMVQRDYPSKIKRLEVLCPPDRRQGRGKKYSPMPVKKFALDNGLVVHHTPEEGRTLKNWEMPKVAPFDIGVVVSFGYFIQPHMLEYLRLGAINLHPSLLPKYRGPAPIQHALLNGDRTTGYSIIDIDPRAFDVGRILLQEEHDIAEDITYDELRKELGEVGAHAIMQVLQDYPSYKANAIAQDDELATKAPKLSKKRMIVDWDHTANDIYRKWQTFGRVSTAFEGEMMLLEGLHRPSAEEIQSNRLESILAQCKPGDFFFNKSSKSLYVICQDQTLLSISQLKLANRKSWSATDFRNGKLLTNRSIYSFINFDAK